MEHLLLNGLVPPPRSSDSFGEVGLWMVSLRSGEQPRQTDNKQIMKSTIKLFLLAKLWEEVIPWMQYMPFMIPITKLSMQFTLWLRLFWPRPLNCYVTDMLIFKLWNIWISNFNQCYISLSLSLNTIPIRNIINIKHKSFCCVVSCRICVMTHVCIADPPIVLFYKTALYMLQE